MLIRILTGVCVVAVGAVAASPDLRTQLVTLGAAPTAAVTENEQTVMYMAKPMPGAEPVAPEEIEQVQARWEQQLEVARSAPIQAAPRKQASKSKKTVGSYYRAANAKKAPKQLGRPKYPTRYGRTAGKYGSSLSNRFGLMGARKTIFENSRFFKQSGRNPNAQRRSPNTRRNFFWGVPRYSAKTLHRSPQNMRRPAALR